MTRLRLHDPADARLDDVRALNASDKSGAGLVIAEGHLVVSRLLESRFPVRCVVGFASKLDQFEELYGSFDDHNARLEAAGEQPFAVFEVSREVLAETVGFDMHRGLVAAADRAPALDVGEVVRSARTVVVLEGVGDHENIGAIFRNAAGMDVDAVLFGNGCADPLYRRSVRVSMGHVLRTPFAHLEGTYTTWQRSLSELRDAGFRLVSLTPHPDAVHLADALEGAEKVALLVGGEGPGLTEHAMRATDVRARIPMAPGTDSLNLATSAAIAFYERQRSLWTAAR